MAPRHALAERRRACGLSQERLAELIRVDRSTIVRWESGETSPRPSLRAPLARALKMSLDDLSELLNTSEMVPAAVGAKRRDSSQVPSIGEPYVQSIYRRIESLLDLDHKMGGKQSAPLALSAFQSVYARLGRSPVEKNCERDLYAAASELAEVAGWFLYEAAEPAMARQTSHQALTLAQLSGKRDIELLVMQNLAMQEAQNGRPMEALFIAQTVLERAPLPPMVEALFRFREALIFAQIGRSSDSRRSLNMAMSIHSTGGSDSDPKWTWWVDGRQISWFQGRVESDLGNASDSVQKLHDAVALTPPEQTRSRYYHLADLMRVQASFGAWTDAARTASELEEYLGVIGSGLVHEIFRETLALATLDRSRSKDVVEMIRDGAKIR
ncbi:conserved hypothetical protein [Frankia canadensis]|uniref:HTH cro/C1-type domain-containing protein n=1 Tax=Frankia canadensis TaxID=1836972 RepID=A0A2I2KMY7_9ACTN|nr:helix-turn-helix transcriptional regulator [Frankia canadensis]SNQ47037.1 conserved hypothetical protein [Frankia canadensis]SOU54327.1 conserved hypothetical protein [Frankia canadensis]